MCLCVWFDFVALQNSPETTELLAQNGALVDMADLNGQTPLHLAAANGYTA